MWLRMPTYEDGSSTPWSSARIYSAAAGAAAARGCHEGRDEATRGSRNKTSEVVGPRTKEPRSLSIACILWSGRFCFVWRDYPLLRPVARCCHDPPVTQAVQRGIGLFSWCPRVFCCLSGRSVGPSWLLCLERWRQSTGARSRTCARVLRLVRDVFCFYFYQGGLQDTTRGRHVFLILLVIGEFPVFCRGRVACVRSFVRSFVRACATMSDLACPLCPQTWSMGG